jgi:hypothetical protein
MKNAALVNHMGLYEVCNIKDVGSHVMACGPTVARTARTLKIQLTSCESFTIEQWFFSLFCDVEEVVVIHKLI